MNRCTWPGSSIRSQKPWGHEISWTGIFPGKELFIKASHSTSLKFNVFKNEMLYIQSGEILAEFADEGHLRDPVAHPSKRRTLLPGDCLNIQAGCPYRLSAIKDSTVFEISDSTSCSDKVVIEDDYGRDTTEAERQKLIFNPLT